MAHTVATLIPFILSGGLEGIAAAEAHSVGRQSELSLVDEAYNLGITMTENLAKEEELILVDDLEEMIIKVAEQRTLLWLDAVFPLEEPWESMMDRLAPVAVGKVFDQIDTPEERKAWLEKMTKVYLRTQDGVRSWRKLRKAKREQRKAEREARNKMASPDTGV